MTRDRVISFISKVTKTPEELVEKAYSEDDYFDSFARIEIILILEEEFSLSFSSEEISSLKSVESIVSAIESRQ